MKKEADELRKKYMDNPPEGYTKRDFTIMSDEELLDMEYFLNEDINDIFGLTPSNETVKFKCKKCNFEEDVPKNIVDMLDESDGGDPNYPPRFSCERCNGGLMYPVNYTNSRGITYKF